VQKKFTSAALGQRIGLVCSFVALIFTFFAFRLVNLQVGGHEKFSHLAAEKHGVKQPIAAVRGNIFDRHGEVLAVNVPVRTVYADGTHIKDPLALAHVAAPFLGLPEKELALKLASKRPYVVIRSGISELDATAMMRALEESKLSGLYLQPGSERSYPNGKMLSHVLGFVDHSGHGIDGIERTFDKELAGRNGYRHIEHDRKGLEIVLYRGQEEPVINGTNIYLTIDMGLQAILEKQLDSAMETYKPAGATAILVDPKTGEILAMGSRPNYDPNHYSEATPEELRNRAVTDMYEPGSVFKVVAASGAINEGIVTENSTIFCEHGAFLYGGKILHDAHGDYFGDLSVRDVLVHSSNIGAAKIAMKMGDTKYYEYVRRFGFGEKTNIPLPGEISGLVNPPARWDKLTITRMAMGHAIAATPIQVVMEIACIANDGKLMVPQLIHHRDQEKEKMEPIVRREIISSKVAEIINGALIDVVARGTAQHAKMDGYSVAGKTGTAQKINTHGGYLEGRYIVSFAGYFPAEKPRIAGLVVIDDARIGSIANFGGLVAAPIFSKIGEASARYLDLLPSSTGASVSKENASSPSSSIPKVEAP
jgi:cell division protein FtsI (penicillin-binding protein 3)/stage V sporulation protein D (sporulation-specific penicillin-binding protein)